MRSPILNEIDQAAHRRWEEYNVKDFVAQGIFQTDSEQAKPPKAVVINDRSKL